MLQNPFNSYIGVTLGRDHDMGSIVDELDKRLTLIVYPDENRLEVSTGYAGRLPAISYEEYSCLARGKNVNYPLETQDDYNWYESFREECLGDWELPLKGKVNDIRYKMEAVM